MNEQGLIVIFLLLSIVFSFVVFNILIPKLLKIERKKWFSYNHVNDLHKKIDFTIRLIFTLLLFTRIFYPIFTDSIEMSWYFELWFILIVSYLLTDSVRCYMEWKCEASHRA